MELRIKNGVLAAIQEYSSNDRERALVDYILLQLDLTREDFGKLTDKQAEAALNKGWRTELIEEVKARKAPVEQKPRERTARIPKPKKEVTE